MEGVGTSNTYPRVATSGVYSLQQEATTMAGNTTVKVQVRDVCLWTGGKAGEAEAGLVKGNPNGVTLGLPNGEKVKFMPMKGTSVPALKPTEGKEAWTKFYEANRGKTVDLAVVGA